ncbi:transposase [Streptomyces sp. AC550_RSS872]|uniref:transposase n=1 Tax=Streptomyces sp. AC550_RSS872 TaxID=2823689 RepID=UPI001C254F03
MARLRVPRRRGRPRTRPDVVLADTAYSSRAIRDHLRKRGIRAVIPIPADQRGHRLRRGSRGGRPPAFDRETYKQRNTGPPWSPRPGRTARASRRERGAGSRRRCPGAGPLPSPCSRGPSRG